MRVALAALALCASTPALGAADAGLGDAAGVASLSREATDAGSSEDEAVIRELDLLESLELLERMDVLDPGAAGR